MVLYNTTERNTRTMHGERTIYNNTGPKSRKQINKPEKLHRLEHFGNILSLWIKKL